MCEKSFSYQTLNPRFFHYAPSISPSNAKPTMWFPNAAAVSISTDPSAAARPNAISRNPTSSRCSLDCRRRRAGKTQINLALRRYVSWNRRQGYVAAPKWRRDALRGFRGQCGRRAHPLPVAETASGLSTPDRPVWQPRLRRTGGCPSGRPLYALLGDELHGKTTYPGLC